MWIDGCVALNAGARWTVWDALRTCHHDPQAAQRARKGKPRAGQQGGKSGLTARRLLPRQPSWQLPWPLPLPPCDQAQAPRPQPPAPAGGGGGGGAAGGQAGGHAGRHSRRWRQGLPRAACPCQPCLPAPSLISPPAARHATSRRPRQPPRSFKASKPSRPASQRPASPAGPGTCHRAGPHTCRSGAAGGPARCASWRAGRQWGPPGTACAPGRRAQTCRAGRG